ncbi:MAG: sulfur carrier protein ThiS [Luteolibacter sp.]|jgi:sulfur carrier protein
MNTHIMLNGRSHPVTGPLPLAELLDSLGLANKPVVVEIDGAAILPRDHPSTTVQPDARVEIVMLAAGG